LLTFATSIAPLVQANDDAKEKKERRKSLALESLKRDLVLTPHREPRKSILAKDVPAE
jgi:hypothetical protein